MSGFMLLNNAQPNDAGNLTYENLLEAIRKVQPTYRRQARFVVHPVYLDGAYLGCNFPTLAAYWPFAQTMSHFGLFC